MSGKERLRLHTDSLDLWSLEYLQESQLSRGLGEDRQKFMQSKCWDDIRKEKESNN